MTSDTATSPRSGQRRPSVVVLDYGSGNVHSVHHALTRLGADAEVTASPERILAADGLIVPGVGSYHEVMKGLRAINGQIWIGRRIAGAQPVLGICVGHQILFEQGIEHGVRTEGLAEWPGTVEKIPADVLPHMGWSTVQPPQDSVLFKGLEDERFYFVHSYGVLNWEFDQTIEVMKPPQVTWADHNGAKFVAAVENFGLSGTQFHPEKSGDAGMQLLTNWLETL